MLLSERLIRLREDAKLSKKEVAEKLSIDQTTYGKYELGKRQPSLEILDELSTFFDVTTDYLLGKSNSPKPELVVSDGLAEREMTLETFARNQGITDEEDIKSLKHLMTLMKMKNYNAELANEFIFKDYIRK